MKTIRIYYECLEQAHHYIRPVVDEVTTRPDSVLLVRCPRNAKSLPPGTVSAIWSLGMPDVLITGVADGIEHPLAIVEFSEAVTTEDHELQRHFGAVSAALAKIFYIKVSGLKETEKEFGGADYDPYSTPKIFKEKLDYDGYVIAEWKTRPDNRNLLERDERYLSCPRPIPILEDTITTAVSTFLESPDGWYPRALQSLAERETFREYRREVSNASGARALLERWKSRIATNLNKTRYFVEDGKIRIKINRFSHAMDPDRGILIFVSLMFSEDFRIYGIYALVREGGGDLMKADLDRDNFSRKLDEALRKDKPPSWFSEALRERARKEPIRLSNQVDFQDVWVRHREEVATSKVMTTLAYFLDGMHLNHNGILVKWDRRELLGGTAGSHIELVSSHFGFNQHAGPVDVTPVQDQINEDEVAYAVVHFMLVPNSFRIVAVSYPGSQGGSAILPEPDRGRSQRRIYLDVIAIPPKGSTPVSVLLKECVAGFTTKGIQERVSKLEKFKTDEKTKAALDKAMSKLLEEDFTAQRVATGIAFGRKQNQKTNWDQPGADFFFVVFDRARWEVYVWDSDLADLIEKTKGETEYPEVHQVSPTSPGPVGHMDIPLPAPKD